MIKSRRAGRTAFRSICRSCAVLALLSLVGPWCTAARAAVDAGTTTGPLPEILVIGTTPVPGMTIDIDKVPGNVQSIFAADLSRDGAADLAAALGSRLGSVSISDALADPFQPDILYRGFEASPVLGTPQGLAIYQNGVRINEAFGDSVNWDLIPDIAIKRLDIVTSSPLYGLNALGGAMAITMKNGFTDDGGAAELSGGSFNKRAISAAIGAHSETLGVYAAIRALNQDGWRRFAHDSLREAYLDLSVHAAWTTADLSYTRADNQLFGPGAAPVQSLALDPGAVFTGPQANHNKLDFMTLDAAHFINPSLALQGVAYLRDYRQDVSNGNGSGFAACATPADSGSLCQPDGVTPLTNSAGSRLPDISQGGALIIGQNDAEAIHSQTVGGSLQMTLSAPLLGRSNQFAAGATIDASHTNFMSETQVGVVDAALIVEPSTLFVDTPEGTPFSTTPVRLNADTKYYGFFATDTFDPTTSLSLTVSARYNIAKVDLSDQRGGDLNGRNRFAHLNPAAGATYKLSAAVTAFAGLSINNRAPTASEIECSDPLRPCLLPSSLAGDPPTLKQVIARTSEVGLRGHAGPLSWNTSLFRTAVTDDIYGISTSVSTGYFQNIGATRRQGVETGLNLQTERISASAQYSYIDATFRVPLTLYSPANPFQDANGDIHVRSGDRLPGIPRHRFKLSADQAVTAEWSVGASLQWLGSQYYHGDESNQNGPLPGYAVVSLRSTYRVSPHAVLFATVQNLLDAHYASYGLYGDPTGVGAPGIPADAAANDPRVDNRLQNPAAPRSVFGGVRLTF